MSAEMPKMVACTDCGMPCDPREYHPFAACLMFKACHSSDAVRANLEAVRQEAARQAMERECEWTRDSDFESEVWNTACGNAFIFTDGGPAENDAKFCCYCGGKLRALIPQDPDHLAGVGNMVEAPTSGSGPEKRHG